MINAGLQNTHRTGRSDEHIKLREERIQPAMECIAFGEQFEYRAAEIPRPNSNRGKIAGS